MSTPDTLKVLNELIRTSEDGDRGFTEAANITKDAQLKLLFQDCAQQCHEAVIDLQDEVALLGGKFSESGTATGAARRAWINLKSSIGIEDVSLLEEVEREEDKAKAVYLNAVRTELPAKIKGLVQAQCEGAVRNHDRVRDLRNRYRAGV